MLLSIRQALEILPKEMKHKTSTTVNKAECGKKIPENLLSTIFPWENAFCSISDYITTGDFGWCTHHCSVLKETDLLSFGNCVECTAMRLCTETWKRGCRLSSWELLWRQGSPTASQICSLTRLLTDNCWNLPVSQGMESWAWRAGDSHSAPQAAQQLSGSHCS